MDNVRLIRDVPYPLPLDGASPRRLTGILQNAGFTFDAVKERLGTEYRQFSPMGAGMGGKFRAFVECAGMRADIGARMFGPSGSGILDTIADYFKKRGPKDQLDVLIWLFLFNEPVKVTALSSIFSPDDLNALAAMNLIRLDAGRAICDLALYECAGLFLATDAIVKMNHPTVANPVMALLPESYDFVGSVSRKPVNSALDLCTGSGVHALVAARHAKHVVATDFNPRALHFAEFNAWFNGITNIEFCRGDLFHAVEGRTFDLILANPPYIPDTASSPNDNCYCGGESGDVLWSQILQGLEKHLRPGGLCQMIHMTVYFGSESPEDRVRSLLGPLANFCDIVIFSNPIDFRNDETAAAASVHFGVTTIKRAVKPGGRYYVQAPFDPPFLLDVSDLLFVLKQTCNPEERALACERHCAQSRRDRVFSGAGTAMRIVSFVAFCAACCAEVARNALHIFHGIGAYTAKVSQSSAIFKARHERLGRLRRFSPATTRIRPTGVDRGGENMGAP
jgi:SAM-dependent methyltransferase